MMPEKVRREGHFCVKTYNYKYFSICLQLPIIEAWRQWKNKMVELTEL